jgi:hypothetical protein
MPKKHPFSSVANVYINNLPVVIAELAKMVQELRRNHLSSIINSVLFIACVRRSLEFM